MRRNPKLSKNVRSYFREYCNASSIHGLRYFGERRTYIERGWWIIVFVVSLSVCAYAITLTYKKWKENPIFSIKETPIYEIPFPAVTICPETKCVKKYYNHSETARKLAMGKQLTPKEYKYASYMNLICDFNIYDMFPGRLDNYTGNFPPFIISQYKNNDFFDFLHEVTPKRSDIILECRWMNSGRDCDFLFRPIITDEGICYTFNMLEHEDLYNNNVFFPNVTFFNPRPYTKRPHNVHWSLDEGYKKNNDRDTYPRRALLSGIRNALELLLVDDSVNTDDFCKYSLQGYKVSLHTPSIIPRPSQEHFRVNVNEMVVTAVQPVMITTLEKLKAFKPYIRECYFQNEKPLKYFKKYSQQNCNLECLTNFTYYSCGCVNFFMPRENDTNICGELMKECTEITEQFSDKWHLPYKLDHNFKFKKISNTEEMPPECNCLPVCSDLSYNIETSSSHWDMEKFWSAINSSLEDENKGKSFSRLIIYFKNTQFVTSKRHELYGPTDFLGNFGGLLGHFTGFSILSLMEIIYFLTVRIICNIGLYRNWSGCEKD